MMLASTLIQTIMVLFLLIKNLLTTFYKNGGGVQPRDFGFIPPAITLFSSQKASSLIPLHQLKNGCSKFIQKLKILKYLITGRSN